MSVTFHGYVLRNGAGDVVSVIPSTQPKAAAVGKPKEKIRIEPVTEPIPEKTPAPVEAPSETPAEPVEVPS